MTKMVKKICLCSVFFFCLALSGIFAAISGAKAEAVWSNVSIEKTYLTGEVFNAPSRTLTINGTQHEAFSKIVRPDGTATSSKSVVLSVAGKYLLQYYLIAEGVPYSESFSFSVKERAFEYFNDESSAVYGKGAYEASPDTDGVYVKLKEQDTLSFRQTIYVPDVNEDIPLVKYFIAPDAAGSADFTRITFTFTDVKDSSNYLRIIAQSSRPDTDDGKGGCYLLAGGNGQQPKGDQGGIIHVNNNYGARSNGGSFFGYKVLGGNASGGLNLKAVQDPSELAVQLKFNPATCEVKADDTLIIDTDSKVYYGGVADVKWTGFTSGNIRLTVKCEGYNTASANFVVNSVKDIDLSCAGYEDTVPPEITVETEYDTENMPYARAGEKEYYRIPAASAYDLITGECKVNVEVYKYYGTESQTRVNVKNGAFNTRDAADYAIIYTAADSFGNFAEEKVVYVIARENLPEMIFGVDGLDETSEIGKKITIPYPKISGGSGNKTVTARVYSGEKEFKFDESDEPWVFYPETLGEWIVEYSATDYTGHTEKYERAISVTAAVAPFFRETAIMPPFLIGGMGNKLPELVAYDYTSGKPDKEVADVIITDKNGTKKYKAGDIYVPEVENDGDAAKIIYYYDNGTSSTEQSFSVPVISAYENGSLAVANYFRAVGENSFSKKVTEKGVKFTSSQGDHSWTFANALVSNGFNITFGGVKNRCVYDFMTITLIDSVNGEERLVINIERSEYGALRLSCGDIKDGVSFTQTDGENEDVIQSLTIELNRNRLLVNGYAYDVESFADGSKFEGFSSGMVYLNFTVTGAEENSEYYVGTVNSYSITKARQDRSAPNISLSGDYGGFYKKGENYVICSAISADVLAPTVDFKLNVRDAENNYVTSVDGVLLKDADPTVTHVVSLHKYGVYTISYTSAENNAPRQNLNDFSYEVNVIDDEAPVFEINGNIGTSVKKGTSVVLPEYTVTDNLTATENVVAYIIVQNPNGRTTLVTEGKFRFEYAGEYEIRYYFADEAGNVSGTSFKVIVE